MKKVGPTFWLSLALFWAAPGLAVESQTPLSLDFANKPEEVRVGDRLELEVAPIPSEVTLAADVPNAANESDRESLAENWALLWRKPPREEGGKAVLLAHPLRAGTLKLPVLEIKDAAGRSVGKTNELSLKVTSSIAGQAPPEEQKPLPPEALPFPLHVLITIVALGLILLSAGSYLLVRELRRRARARPLPSVAVVEKTPEEELFAAFENARVPLQTGLLKKHAFALSEAIKKYIERKYDVPAVEATSEEVFALLDAKRVENGFPTARKVETLKALFARFDVVKFSNQPIDADEVHAFETRAREWVQVL